jgi:hypothetical protein
MDTSQDSFYTNYTPDLVADVRDAMSRRGDFDLSPEQYADETNIFEALAVLEALTIDNEILV